MLVAQRSRLLLDSLSQQSNSRKDIHAEVWLLLPTTVHDLDQAPFFGAAVLVQRVNVRTLSSSDFALHDSVIFVLVERPEPCELHVTILKMQVTSEKIVQLEYNNITATIN